MRQQLMQYLEGFGFKLDEGAADAQFVAKLIEGAISELPDASPRAVIGRFLSGGRPLTAFLQKT